MRKLTKKGQQIVNKLAKDYNISTDAVMAMLDAVSAGGGTMAQFNIPELGGGGQWMQGGMTMVGDMFNYGLKSTVESLCAELSTLLAQQPFQAATTIPSKPVSLFVPDPRGSSFWWPEGLGNASSTGGQNNLRYAYFADSRRLAVDVFGNVAVYDTLDHQIGGVSQQQGSGSSFTFTSQYGTVHLASLPVISRQGVDMHHRPIQASVQHESMQPMATQAQSQSGPQMQSQFQSPVQAPSQSPTQAQPMPKEEPRSKAKRKPKAKAKPSASVAHQKKHAKEEDVIVLLERLGELKDKGILTEAEFNAKKQELLDKI